MKVQSGRAKMAALGGRRLLHAVEPRQVTGRSEITQSS